MDLLTRDTEMIPCPHCQTPVRRGMIRCRDCGGVVAEDCVADGGASRATVRRCDRCGSDMEPGTNECAKCAGSLLDELLNGLGDRSSVGQFAAGSRETSSMSGERFGASQSKTWNKAVPEARQDEGEPREEPPTSPASREATPSRFAKKPAGRAKGGPAEEVDPLEFLQNDEEPNESPVPSRASARESSRPSSRASAEARSPARRSAAEALPSGESSSVDTNEACAALILSLSAGDLELRCQAATALGKLGNAEAMPSLERLLVDPELRVRRAAAEAMIQFGHPKGRSLLEIADRKPIAATAAAGRKPSGYAQARASRSSADGGSLAKIAGGAVAVVVLGGGIWWWQNQPAAAPPKKTQTIGAKGPKIIGQPVAAPVAPPASAPAAPAAGSSVWDTAP